MTQLATIALLALFVAGCVQSLQPLYSDQTIFTDSTFIGTWEDRKEGNIWRFSPGQNRSYSLDYIEGESPARFEVYLVKIGPHHFVDFFPHEANLGNELYKSHLLPSHSFARLNRSGDTLKLAFLNYDWIKVLAQKGRLSIASQSVNGRYVLTATTAQLQKFVRANATNPSAFMEPLILIRARAE